MLNIVIMSGGTGSIALQKGLNELLGADNYNTDIIINAYDNGKSTGACRKIFNNDILGPSDLRKNQITVFENTYSEELTNSESYESKLLDLFELRFSADGFEQYYNKAKQIIADSDFLHGDITEKLQYWLRYFFFENYDEKKFRDVLKEIEFKDFSLSNIFYASCAALNNNLLGQAGTEMARILRIKDCVHLISDVDLFLKAKTQKGNIIGDEGDIVCWDNPDDKIIKVFLTDKNGKENIPQVGERGKSDIYKIINDADIIIFSSGTQWSSLIPTYMHKGFREMILNAKAKKYLVMNNIEDHDMLGICADQILEIINEYIDLKDIKIVINNNAASTMNNISDKYLSVYGDLSIPGNAKHIPTELVGTIFKNFFCIENQNILISDLDGTLWEELGDEKMKKTGKQNLEIFEGIIFSGNSYEHVSEIADKLFINKNGNAVYCDYGNTYFYKGSNERFVLSEEFLIDDNLLEDFKQIDDFSQKAFIRGGVILTVKPLSNRPEQLKRINHILEKYNGKYSARIAGRTSIDIVKSSFSKEAALRILIEKNNFDKNNIIYLGNELYEGNEVCINNIGIRTIQINDVYDANTFLRVWNKTIAQGIN